VREQLLWAEPAKQGCWWAGIESGADDTDTPMLGTWASLRQNRDMFLTRAFVKQCLAFAQGQIKQAEAKPEVNGKKARTSWEGAVALVSWTHGHYI
jgi:hypothetical protein